MTGPPPVCRRVVHVITRYAGGGSERRLRDLVAATPEHEHHLIVGAETCHDLLSEQLRDVPVHIEPRLRRELHPVNDALALASLSRLLRRLSPDLVVTHQSKAGVLGRLLASRSGVPSIHSLSMATFGPGYPSPARALFRFVERRMAAHTGTYVVVGHDLADAYQRMGVPSELLRVVRSAATVPDVPADRHVASRELCRIAGLPPSRPTLAYVGSLDARKNVFALLDVLEAVQRRVHPAPRLLVVGEGPLSGELRRRTSQRGLGDHVVQLGYLEDPAPVFQGADAILLCSRAEGLPQVLVQAAAAGTPFVSFEVSGTRELVAAGAEGEVVPWGDVAAAAAAVDRVLAGAAERTGRRIDLTEWSPASVRARYAEVVRELLPPADSATHQGASGAG